MTFGQKKSQRTEERRAPMWSRWEIVATKLLERQHKKKFTERIFEGYEIMREERSESFYVFTKELNRWRVDPHTSQQFDLIQSCLCIVLGALHHFHGHKVFHPVRTHRCLVISDLKKSIIYKIVHATDITMQIFSYFIKYIDIDMDISRANKMVSTSCYYI